jgi:hypothetical protein
MHFFPLGREVSSVNTRSRKMFLGSRADNLAAICEPIVQTVWDPRNLTTLRASTACYGDSFTLYFVMLRYCAVYMNTVCGQFQGFATGRLCEGRVPLVARDVSQRAEIRAGGGGLGDRVIHLPHWVVSECDAS